MDGEVDDDLKATIEEHLRRCQTCQQLLGKLDKAWNLLSLLPEAESAPYFFTRLRTKLTTEKADKRSKLIDRVLIPATAVAVTILGIITGDIVGKNGDAMAEQLTEDEIISALYLDSFDDFPTASLGEVYFDLVSQE